MFSTKFIEIFKAVTAKNPESTNLILLSLFKKDKMKAQHDADVDEFRRCFAVSCSVRETRDMKFSNCKRCKRAYYCSQVCQAADWPDHKFICLRAQI